MFISAPPASGKGRLELAVTELRVIQKLLKDQYEKEKEKYEVELEAAKENPDLEKPQNPLKKKLIIPGNISSSALLRMLSNNDGRGIFFETEANTLASTSFNDWASYSDILRKMFQHEAVSQCRVSDDVDIEIFSPYCSALLSGTPDQIPKLIQGVDNGLFSRFAFYNYKSSFRWKNVFDFSQAEYEELINGSFAKLCIELYHKLIEGPIYNFKLTADQ